MKQRHFLLVVALSVVAACGGSAGVAGVPSPEGGSHGSYDGDGLDSDDIGEAGSSSSGGTFNVNVNNNSNSSVDAAAYAWMATCAGRCAGGQVCCTGTIASAIGTDLPPIGTSNCQAGPCPTLGGLGWQLCSSAAECFTPGDTCGPIGGSYQSLVVMVCNPPRGDGNADSGISDALIDR